MKYYVIGEDKSLQEAPTLQDVLQLSGGNMTGNIGFNSGTRIGDIIKFIAGNSSGSGIAIGDGGCVVIGSGESADLFTPEDGAVEETIIASDRGITFWVNAQNGADSAVQVTLSTAGLLSGHQKAISSGTAAPTGGSNGDIYIQY
ncbi:hypothetical protein [Anaerotignum sp.]